MDGNDGKKPRGGKKPAERPTPATDAMLPQPAARADLETTALSDDNDSAPRVDVGQTDVASVDESHGGGGAEEEEDNRDDGDDEQVERFYALLANIRAMRGLAPHNVASSLSFAVRGDNDDTDADIVSAGDDSTRTKKRLRRSAEPPWRPAFRMEDFEEPPPLPASSSSFKLRKLTTTGADHGDDHCGHGESSEGSARPTTSVAVVASSSMPHAAVRFQQSDSSS